MEHTLNHGMCRCCASEGMFKNFTATYQWMGADEVYADMLKECFDVSLTTAEDYNNGGICEVCITQLRNASNFKKQVLQTEEQFKKALQDDIFKSSIVKEEVNKEDGDFDSDNNISEDFSGTEFEVPIKEENVEPKAKKRSTKASTSSAKRAKKEDGEPSNKRQQGEVIVKIESCDVSTDEFKPEIVVCEVRGTDQIDKSKQPKKTVTRKKDKTDTGEAKEKKLRKKKVSNRMPELKENRVNLNGILQYSNATPIRSHGDFGFECNFCSDQYPDPADLKKHVIETHDSKTMVNGLKNKRVHTIRMDITDLRCNICEENMYDLPQLVSHLVDSHQKTLYKNVINYILPVKFEGTALNCYICSKTINNYKGLVEHMNTHFRNFVCDVCDAGFISKDNLREHAKTHKVGTHKCDFCPKQFSTALKKKSHERLVHITKNMVNKCGICNKKFKGHYKKILHLAEAHGIEPTILKCNACDKKFTDQRALRLHVQMYHLLERPHGCTECDMRFFKKGDLQEHMVKHTGVREFQCEVCLKAYGRKDTLRQHMRIHRDERRFKCEHCGMAFVQKCSWKGHMRAKHGECV